MGITKNKMKWFVRGVDLLAIVFGSLALICNL